MDQGRREKWLVFPRLVFAVVPQCDQHMVLVLLSLASVGLYDEPMSSTRERQAFAVRAGLEEHARHMASGGTKC